MKTIFKMVIVLLAVVSFMGLTVDKADAATELGEYCWNVSHPVFSGGVTHLLRLQVTQMGSNYALHGRDATSNLTADGNAYVTGSLVIFGINTTHAYGSPYFLGADLNSTTLSSTFGWIEMNDGTRYTSVSVTFVPCPPVAAESNSAPR